MNQSDTKNNLGPIFLLIFGILGLLINFGLAVFLIGLSLHGIITGQSENATMALWVGITFLGLSILGVPLIYWAIQSLRGNNPPVETKNRYWIVAILLYPLALIVGYASIELMRLPGIFGPIANFVAAASPVILAVSLLRLNGPALRPTRMWGHFLAGLWLVPPIVFAIELLALIPFLITMGFGLLGSESGRSLIMQFSRVDLNNIVQVEELAEGLLQEPFVVILAFLLFSLAVPIIEEAAKTIVIWPLLPRKITSSGAFLGGAIGGAGFALFESLFLAQQAGLWFASMLGRTGTSFIHALTTGITCWGLAKSFKERQLRWFFASYLLAVILHGTWNAAALGIGFSSISIPLEGQSTFEQVPPTIVAAGIGILVSFTAAALVALVSLMRRINQGSQVEVSIN